MSASEHQKGGQTVAYGHEKEGSILAPTPRPADPISQPYLTNPALVPPTPQAQMESTVPRLGDPTAQVIAQQQMQSAPRPTGFAPETVIAPTPTIRYIHGLEETGGAQLGQAIGRSELSGGFIVPLPVQPIAPTKISPLAHIKEAPAPDYGGSSFSLGGKTEPLVTFTSVESATAYLKSKYPGTAISPLYSSVRGTPHIGPSMPNTDISNLTGFSMTQPTTKSVPPTEGPIQKYILDPLGLDSLGSVSHKVRESGAPETATILMPFPAGGFGSVASRIAGGAAIGAFSAEMQGGSPAQIIESAGLSAATFEIGARVGGLIGKGVTALRGVPEVGASNLVPGPEDSLIDVHSFPGEYSVYGSGRLSESGINYADVEGSFPTKPQGFYESGAIKTPSGELLEAPPPTPSEAVPAGPYKGSPELDFQATERDLSGPMKPMDVTEVSGKGATVQKVGGVGSASLTEGTGYAHRFAEQDLAGLDYETVRYPPGSVYDPALSRVELFNAGTIRETSLAGRFLLPSSLFYSPTTSPLRTQTAAPILVPIQTPNWSRAQVPTNVPRARPETTPTIVSTTPAKTRTPISPILTPILTPVMPIKTPAITPIDVPITTPRFITIPTSVTVPITTHIPSTITVPTTTMIPRTTPVPPPIIPVPTVPSFKPQGSPPSFGLRSPPSEKKDKRFSFSAFGFRTKYHPTDIHVLSLGDVIRKKGGRKKRS